MDFVFKGKATGSSESTFCKVCSISVAVSVRLPAETLEVRITKVGMVKDTPACEWIQEVSLDLQVIIKDA
jgi:hypothetical protein